MRRQPQCLFPRLDARRRPFAHRAAAATAAGTTTKLPTGGEVTIIAASVSHRVSHGKEVGQRCRPEAPSGASGHKRPATAATVTVPEICAMWPSRCNHPTTGKRRGTVGASIHLGTAAAAAAVWYTRRCGTRAGTREDWEKIEKRREEKDGVGRRWGDRQESQLCPKSQQRRVFRRSAARARYAVGATLAPLGRAPSAARFHCGATFA